MNKRAFGELEMDILKVLKPDEKVTVKDVSRLLGDKDKYNTIMTVMLRMTQKNLLERERTGLQYQYWLKETLPAFMKKKLAGVKPVEMMCYLFESAETVSDDELQQMEKILEKIKLERTKQK